jgi:hypothetical protein
MTTVTKPSVCFKADFRSVRKTLINESFSDTAGKYTGRKSGKEFGQKSFCNYISDRRSTVASGCGNQ